MSGKLKPVAIGAFLVAAVLMIFGMLLFFGGKEFFGAGQERREATVIFTGSVKGLNVGAPVTMRGVKIGDVKKISVTFDPRSLEFVIPVMIEINLRDLNMDPSIDKSAELEPLIERGMRAQLKTQSILTGLLYVDLDFLPGTEPRYVDFPTETLQIPTAPTELEAILQRVSELDVQSFLQHLDQTIRDIDTLLSDPQAKQIAGNVNATLESVQTLAANVDTRLAELGERIDGLVASADGAVSGTREDVQQLSRRVQLSLDNLDSTLQGVRDAAQGFDFAVSGQSPLFYELTRAVEELARAGRALQSLADTLERQPESVLRGKNAETRR